MSPFFAQFSHLFSTMRNDLSWQIVNIKITLEFENYVKSNDSIWFDFSCDRNTKRNPKMESRIGWAVYWSQAPFPTILWNVKSFRFRMSRTFIPTKEKMEKTNVNKWPSIANNLVNICCVSWNKLEKLWNVHSYEINAISKIANGSLKTDRQIQSGLVKQWLIFDEPIGVYCHVEVVYVNIKKPISALLIRFQVISERVSKKIKCMPKWMPSEHKLPKFFK